MRNKKQLLFITTAACLFLYFPSIPAEKSRYTEPYPTAKSKKGLQVEIVEDALSLGVKHAALNFNLSQLIDPDCNPNNPVWIIDGNKYHFKKPYLNEIDSRIKALSEKGVLVNIIILAYQSGNDKIDKLILHPQAAKNPPNRLCAFNNVTEEGRRWFVATMEFISERWSKPDKQYGRVAGYIIGNEVNSHWWWYNMGRVTMKEFTADYLRTVRLAHGAIRRQSSWARVYISLEHHWNMRYLAGDEKQAFGGQPFLKYFTQLAKKDGDFDWHLAFHPYPENLRNPKFWNDKSATIKPNTPRITFKNLHMLTEYMNQPQMSYSNNPRRIILSEQGFDTPKTTNGELIQAAAYCYAYKIVESLDGIDSFILHRHIDHRNEGGLLLGLRRWDKEHSKKKIYECFYFADTPKWEKVFEFALPIIGIKNWP